LPFTGYRFFLHIFAGAGTGAGAGARGRARADKIEKSGARAGAAEMGL